MYLSKIRPWKSSKCIAPPPHEIARIRREAGTGNGDEEIADKKHSEEVEKPAVATDPNVNGAGTTDGATQKEGQA
jgi:SP family sugar:H+ symporter-like MFS transporter